MQQIETITVDQLADILIDATIISTVDHSGMLIHSISHPTIGKATTIQADSGAVLINGL